MKIEMPKLPYEFGALSPVISEQTMNFHYGKHLQNYVNTLGNLVKDSDLEGKSVEEIVKQAPLGPIYNNAGQVLNHTLYFTQFKPASADNRPEGRLAQLIEEAFGSFDDFKQQFARRSRQTRHHERAQRRQPFARRPQSARRHRRMGARLLS